MANTLSAKKRIRQTASRRARNRWRKVDIRDAVKDYRELILHGTVEASTEKLQAIYKMLDQTASTSTMHKNTAARTKSRLTALLNQKKAAPAAA